jgi:hypothetical protein
MSRATNAATRRRKGYRGGFPLANKSRGPAASRNDDNLEVWQGSRRIDFVKLWLNLWRARRGLMSFGRVYSGVEPDHLGICNQRLTRFPALLSLQTSFEAYSNHSTAIRQSFRALPFLQRHPLTGCF